MSVIEGTFFWSAALDHPAFPGHFPGHPIVPGVVLLDQALHGICQAHGWSEAPSRMRITVCKFLSPVQPGEMLRIAHQQQSNGAIHFEINGSMNETGTENGRVVATGKLAAPAQKTLVRCNP